MKKVVNNKEYKKAHTISEEILNAIVSGRDLNECQKVKEFLSDNSHSQEFIDNITSLENISQSLKYRNNCNKEKSVGRLISQISQESAKRKKIISYRLQVSISVAAAILLFSFLIYNITDTPKPYITVKYNVDTTFVTPTLITETGANIDVMNLSKKNAVANNYQLSKSDNNTIKYTANNNTDSVVYNTLVIPSGYNYNVTLSDGTEVFLNAGSTLTYPVAFSANSERSVSLTGEAYFKVFKSKNQFVVRLADKQIKVYGTEFNVNQKKNDMIEVVLVEGSIGFTSKNMDEVMMKPNHKLTCIGTEQISIDEVNTELYTIWRTNTFSFTQQNLVNVMYDIAQWYGITIHTSHHIAERKLTFVLDRGTPLEQVFEYISELMHVKIINEGKGVYMVQ